MSWLHDRRTATKLMLAVVPTAIAALIIAVMGVRGLRAANASAERGHQAVTEMKEVVNTMSLLAIGLRSAFITDDPAEIEALVARRGELRAAMTAHLARIDELLETPAERVALARFLDLRGRSKKFKDDAFAAAIAKDRATALAALARSAPIEREIDAEVARLEQTVTAVAAARVRASFTTTRRWLFGGGGAAVALGLLAAWLLGRSITGPLRRSVEVLDRVAAGDFTASVGLERRDEVGQLAAGLDRATARMRDALRQVRAVADHVAGAAAELSGAAQAVSSGAQHQASSLEESAASIEEMTATIKQSADNAHQASALALDSRASAEQGGQVVVDAVAAMVEIDRSSKAIAEIIGAIDDIAFQTNLLALNAAVEAARAGDQGRGFAVVATEVRNLAQRSAAAAKQIKRLIEDSVRKVEVGAALVDRSGTTLTAIVSSVKRVTDIVTEMASAAREQSTGIDQINQAIAQMDQVTQSNAASTEEMSATAASLTEQAEQLRATVARFRLDDGAGAGADAGADADADADDRLDAGASIASASSPRPRPHSGIVVRAPLRRSRPALSVATARRPLTNVTRSDRP